MVRAFTPDAPMTMFKAVDPAAVSSFLSGCVAGVLKEELVGIKEQLGVMIGFLQKK